MSLILVHLRVAVFNLVQTFPLFFRYYRKWTFVKAHVLLNAYYLAKSPYKVAKQFLMQMGEKEIYTYGETPLTTIDRIAKECRILSKDTVYELGCGRGEALFWLSIFTGCKGVGVDIVPTFIEKAKRLQRTLKLSKVDFRLEDMLDADLRRASVIYFYGTAFSEEMIQKMTAKFAKLPSGTKIISVSYPIETQEYRVEKSFKAAFNWGSTDIFLMVRD